MKKQEKRIEVSNTVASRLIRQMAYRPAGPFALRCLTLGRAWRNPDVAVAFGWAERRA
jgi:hypothetical protein